MSRMRRHRPGARPTPIGPLEMAVLDGLWEAGPQSVVEMQHRVGVARGVSRNTIHSTLERLVRKRLAARRKIGRAYEYRAIVSRGEWIAQSLSAVLDYVPGSDAAHLLAGFVDVAERAGAERLQELERMVQARRRALKDGDDDAPAEEE